MTTEHIVFSVQGSADLYEVIFAKPHDLHATCTCQAGQLGQHCKHRINILAGDDTAIVSGNKSDVQIVLAWLPGTKLAHGIAEVAEAERAAELAKKRLANAKKALGRIMQPPGR